MVALSDLDSKNADKIVRYKNTTKGSDKQASVRHRSCQTRLITGAHPKYPEYDAGTHIATQKRQNQKHLTEDEVQRIIIEYRNGETTYALAEKYCCHRSTISGNLKKHGVTVRNETILPETDLSEMIALYESEHTTAQIAEKFNISVATVLRILRKNGVYIRSRWEYGQR